MKKRNPCWKHKDGWQWHHFEGNGRREMQYVPGIVNDSLRHRNPTIANLRQQAKLLFNDFKSKIPGNAARVVSLTGILLAGAGVVASAANVDENVNTIKRNMELYIQAKEIGDPTSGYSEEVAIGYYNIFGNQMAFHGILWYLESELRGRAKEP